MSGTLYSGSISSGGGRRAGVASATVDGEIVDVAGELSYDPSTVKRETLEGQSGVQGFSEMPKTGLMKFRARDSGSLQVSAFNTKTNSTLVFVLANGKTVYGDGMWNTEVSAVNSAEGTFDLTFEGVSVVESTV